MEKLKINDNPKRECYFCESEEVVVIEIGDNTLPVCREHCMKLFWSLGKIDNYQFEEEE